MNFNNSRLVDHKPMKFGTFVPYMYRFVIIVKYLTNVFKLEWNLGIKFTLSFFFLSVYKWPAGHILYKSTAGRYRLYLLFYIYSKISLTPMECLPWLIRTRFQSRENSSDAQENKYCNILEKLFFHFIL